LCGRLVLAQHAREVHACALERGAAIWTLNPGDFDDIPQLKIYQPVS
jgi:hypothetical protein